MCPGKAGLLTGKKNRLLTYFSLVVKLAFVALDNYPGTCKWDDWVVLMIDRAHVLQFSVDLRRFFFRWANLPGCRFLGVVLQEEVYTKKNLSQRNSRELLEETVAPKASPFFAPPAIPVNAK